MGCALKILEISRKCVSRVVVKSLYVYKLFLKSFKPLTVGSRNVN